jgi:hypothetical protein
MPDGIFFETKNPSLGKFRKVSQWKMLEYFMYIWSILRPLDIFLYILWQFGIFFPVLVCCTEKNLATLLNEPHIELETL